MKVKIVVRPSGLLNGREWPDVGETIDLPDATAEGMAQAGAVELVKATPKEKVEKRPAPDADVETREAPVKKSTARKS